MKHFTEPDNDIRKAVYVIVSCAVALMALSIYDAFEVSASIVLVIFLITASAALAISHVILLTYLPYVEVPPRPLSPPESSKRALGEAITLSSFAKKRINEKIIGPEEWIPVFEQRKPLLELFFQIEKRERTDRNIKKRGLLRKSRGELTKKSTLYEEAFFLLIGSALVIGGVWLAITPEWSVQALGYFVVCAGLIVALWSLIKLYIKWARVYYFRLIGMKLEEDDAVSDAQLVIIDQPPFFKGGGVFPIEFGRIRIVYSATTRSDEDPSTWRSNIAGIIKYEGLIIDTYSDKDKAFNWLGPFFNSPELVAEIKHLQKLVRPEVL